MLIKIFFSIFCINQLGYIQASGIDDLYFEKRNGEMRTFSISSERGTLEVVSNRDNIEAPLGSLWKLFVYAYNRENGVVNAPYTCKGVVNEKAPNSLKEFFAVPTKTTSINDLSI